MAIQDTPRRVGRPIRRPGSPWRILVHEWIGGKRADGIRYGRAYDVSNDPRAREQAAETARYLNGLRPDLPPLPEHTEHHTVLEGTEFDELVIGRWIHLEQMDACVWWMNIGGVTVNIRVDRDGRPRKVDVYGPGDYAYPVEGCEYEVAWTAGSGPPTGTLPG